MEIVSTKFRDTRNGEIVTSVPLSQIAHFDELTTIILSRNGTGWLARFIGGETSRQVKSVFGTNMIPLPLTSLARDSEAEALALSRYPNAIVEVSND